MLWEKIIICTLAGIGAGIGVGLTGMSAAVVISPMLITFLGVPAYDAVGIALAADVPAAAASALTYGRNGNIQLKTGVYMLIAVLVCTLIGSALAALVHNDTLGDISVIWTLVLGLRFLLSPMLGSRSLIKIKNDRQQLILSVISGAATGLVCGFVGAGGGIMLLFILTTVLKYETKTAVGTSVFIMTFSAALGALSHFAIGGVYDWTALLICAAVTLVTAYITSKLANKANAKTLNRDVGILLVSLGVAMFLVNFTM